MGILDFEAIAPAFFIGLGGSGCKVVDRIGHKLRVNPNWSRYRDLIHFVGIDTNVGDLNRHRNIPKENRYLISDFDKRSYIQRKRGQQELDEDRFVTSWVHDWYDFREEQGAGAGQIRIESRLSLFYNLENDRAKIIKKIHDIINLMTAPDNPWRDQKSRVVRVFIYGSIAGGTGSGGFLTTAYLMRDLVEEAGWGRIECVGTLLMPALFSSDVEHVLHVDINANSYAALKELEHLMKLGYEDYDKELVFHYNPTRRDHETVHVRPFNQIYLVDKPAELSVEQYIDAIADSAYLQMFGPILGEQQGAADNIVKRQKALASGHFAVQYGSYGCGVLVFPRNDIIDYAAMRYVEKSLDRYLVLGRDEQFRVPYHDKKFQRLSDEEKNRIIDDKFIRYIDHYAGKEEEEDYAGAFTSIRNLRAPDGSDLKDVFRGILSESFDKLDQLVDITPLDPVQISEQNTSLDRPINDLRRDVADSQKRVDGYLDDLVISLRSDRFWSDFFRRNRVQPLSQRYLLVKLMEAEHLSPFEDPEDAADLFESTENDRDIDKEGVRKDIDRLQDELRAAAKQGFFSKKLGRENVTFERKKGLVMSFFSEADDAYRWSLKRSFWQRFAQELRRSMEARLESFRKVSQIADEMVHQVREEARRFMEDPASRDETSDATAYYLNVEVLRDDRGGRRLWDRFFEDRLDLDANYAPERIFQIITSAFQPAEDESGHLVSKDASAIAREIRERLMGEGRQVFRAAVESLNVDMETALAMEAEYVLAPGAELGNPARSRPATSRIQQYIKDKVQHALAQAVVLANIDRRKFDDPTVTPGRPFYACIAKRYCSDEDGKLGRLVAESDAGVKILDDWNDQDLIVFYRAVYGVPLYFYDRVNGELREDYRKVKAQGTTRGYPLHTDANWEDALPDLDPKEAREASERARREREARERAEAEAGRIRDFSLCAMFGHIARREDGAYELVQGEIRKQLGADRRSAYLAFCEMPAMLRDDMVGESTRRVEEKTSSASERRRFVDDLDRFIAGLKKLHTAAYAEELDREMSFLEEERSAIERLRASLTR